MVVDQLVSKLIHLNNINNNNNNKKKLKKVHIFFILHVQSCLGVNSFLIWNKCLKLFWAAKVRARKFGPE